MSHSVTIQTIPNIYALKNYIQPREGMVYQTLGYYEKFDGGANEYYYKADDTQEDNGGSIIRHMNNGGNFIAINKTIINLRQFGAKGNGVDDDTPFIKSAFSTASQGNRGFVFAPQGDYIVGSTVYIPIGVTLEGVGQIMQGNFGNNTVFRQKQGFSGDVFRFESAIYTGVAWWYGFLRSFSVIGNALNTGGFGLNFKNIEDEEVTVQNDSIIENVSVRRMPSGGVNMFGALPMWMRNLTFQYNKGPGITITAQYATSYQSIGIENLSGDGNVGGLLRLENFNEKYGSLTLINLKSEAISNPDYATGTDDQINAIVCHSCNGLQLNIVGATHISAISDEEYKKKPGSLVKIEDGSTPTITWDNAVIRVRPTDTGDDPSIVESAYISIPYQITSGSIGGFNRIMASYDNNAKLVLGKATEYKNQSVESTAYQVQGVTPAYSFYESDQMEDEKTWLIVASGGVLSERTVDDLGVSSVYREVLRSGGTAQSVIYKTPVKVKILEIDDGVTAPNTASGKASIYVDASDGDLKIKFGDGTIKTIVTDS